jgi:hypothetical protein
MHLKKAFFIIVLIFLITTSKAQSPSISSFTPASGEPGTVLTINGTNFGSVPANNVVYFGAVSAAISNASTTQIVVTVPLGAQHGPIAVTNKTTGLSKHSALPFNPVFSGGGRIIPASFDFKIDIPLSFDIEGLTLADINGDGWTDLAVANNEANAIDIYRNLGLGGDITPASFDTKVTLTTTGSSANEAGLSMTDLDGDGKLDAITSVGLQFGNASFTTFRNVSTPGTIAFDAPAYWQGNRDESPPYFVGDIDGDGRPELVGGEGSSGVGADLWIARNISNPGDIQFAASINFLTGSLDGLSNVAMGDLDNDGKPEMIASHDFGSSFSIIKNTSVPGTLALNVIGEISTEQYNRAVQIVDLNLDGKMDICWRKTS